MTILVNQFQNGIFKPEFIGFIYGKTKAVPDETLEAMKSYYFSESVANLKKNNFKIFMNSTLRRNSYQFNKSNFLRKTKICEYERVSTANKAKI